MSKKVVWLSQEDEILERTMVEALNKGLDQQQGAEIAKNFLPNRTEGACLTRWHLKLRKRHQHLIKPRSQRVPLVHTNNELQLDLTFKNVEHHNVVQSMQDIMNHIQDLSLTNQTLQTENSLLKSDHEILKVQNETLQKQLDIANSKIHELQQDYDSILRIINVARETVVKEDFGSQEKVKFKMDKNGNLNRV